MTSQKPTTSNDTRGPMASTPKALQASFFDYVFSEQKGYICISTRKGNDNKTWKDSFFEWPKQKKDLLAFITTAEKTLNVWFGVHLLSAPRRVSDNCLPTSHVYADLDTCSPDDVTPPPQCIIESSPGRFQAIWTVDQILDPEESAQYSKRIAYTYAAGGADKSGWDLTQLLRVPFTYNYKYDDGETKLPRVELIRADSGTFPVALFDALPEVPDELKAEDVAMPAIDALEDADELCLRFMPGLKQRGFFDLYTEEPDDDWSKPLWRLINICFEVGMEREQAFALALNAACNKYARDKRPISHLWKEVLRAETKHKNLETILGSYEYVQLPVLITKDELEVLPRTIVDDYIDWATETTDASPQYHELGIFMILSMLCAGGIKLQTQYEEMVPNLWGLVLGDSTLTRKTTAMRLAMSFVDDIDRDAILATDGSTEGILSGLSDRPSMVSVYYRDEVAGFLESIAKKEYLAGMSETFAQLYDVPSIYTRRLRKETITISRPIFLFFGGGIRDKTYSLINEQLIIGGFIPRFLIVSGETDLAQHRPTGAPTKGTTEGRERLKQRLSEIHYNYNRTSAITVPGGQQTEINAVAEALLSDDAWKRYQKIEVDMLTAAHKSAMSNMALPCFERMSRSLLKMALLVAASRQDPEDDTIAVEETDILIAAKYIQKWGQYTVDLIMNSGRSLHQKTIDKIYHAVKRQPGIPRGTIMKHHGISARDMDQIERTLIERGQIVAEQAGRAKIYRVVA